MRSVQIIGIGDFKTKLLRKNVDEALQSHQGDVSVINVTEINQIKFFSITATPALSIDGQIVSQGEVPSVEDIRELFKDSEISYPFQKLSNIIVAFDFSSNAESVLRYALYVAERFNAGIELVHILPIESTPLTSLNFTDIDIKKAALQRALRNAVERVWIEDEKNIKKRWNVPMNYTVLNGQPSSELILLSLNAELMILGNSNSQENIYGNTAKQLAHGAHCPLIFVPQNYCFNGISRIVYGCTEKGLNKKTIRSICNFSGFFGSALDFVHVGSEAETEGLKVHIEELLNAIDVKPRIGNFYFTDNRSVVKALMDYTNNFKPDLLVMEHDHSRNGLEHLILGSVTTKAVESLFNIPILILYHP